MIKIKVCLFSVFFLGLGGCKSRSMGSNDETLAVGNSKKQGLFRFAHCESESRSQGSLIKHIFTLNVITNTNGKPSLIQGALSVSTETQGGDFVHGFSTLTGDISSVSFDHGALFLNIRNGMEVINADGDIQKGGKLTLLQVGIEQGSSAKIVIEGKTPVNVNNCLISNKLLFDSVFN